MPLLEQSYPRILKLVDNFSGDVSISIKNLASEETISYRDSEIFPTASTIKTFILGNLLSEIEKGNIALTDRLEMTKKHLAAGSGGILKEFLLGTEYTVHDLAMVMTVLSDNTATNMIIDLLGGVEVINKYIKALGFKDTKLNNRVEFAAIGDDVRNFAVGTTRDFTQYLSMIFKNKLFAANTKQLFFNMMSKQQDISQFARYIPKRAYDVESPQDQVVIAHKTGTFIGVRCDIGLLKVGKNNIVFSVFTDNCEDKLYHLENEGAILLGEIGKEIYQLYACN